MENLRVLKNYFPNGTAEGEREILKEVFIPPALLSEVVTAPQGSPRIVVGTKGVGKTALVERSHDANRAAGIPSLLLRPDDFDLSKISNATDIATTKKAMFEVLVSAIASEVGSKLAGLLSGGAAELHKEAVKKGAKSADRVEKALALLSAIAKPQTGIDFEQLAKSLSGGESHTRLLASLKQHLAARSTVVTLFFDDTDQVASPDDSNHLNRIWGLLLAIRKLANDMPSVACVVTLRTEVWGRLQRDERGQRDQIDHLRPLVVGLRAHDEHMVRILNRRLESASRVVNAGGSVEAFFENKEMVLPGSSEHRSWQSFLLKSARERPRDLIQLVGQLADLAVQRNQKFISSSTAAEVMHRYSEERVSDLAIEVGRDCPSFKEVVMSFAGLAFDLDFEQLRAHLSTLPSRFSLIIRSKAVQVEDKSGPLAILGVLFEAGVVNARVRDSQAPKGFRHVNFADDPHLITPARWNDLQAMRWEVHPAFRTYLLDLDKAKERSGR